MGSIVILWNFLNKYVKY